MELTLSEHGETGGGRRLPQCIVGNAGVDPCVRSVETLYLHPCGDGVALGAASSLGGGKGGSLGIRTDQIKWSNRKILNSFILNEYMKDC